jgi:hypothetical protein
MIASPLPRPDPPRLALPAGGKFAPPEVLEDSVIELERKGGLFGGGSGNDVSMADLVRSLKIEK